MITISKSFHNCPYRAQGFSMKRLSDKGQETI